MSSNNQQNSQQYSAKNIQSLTPREHIRKRPGMYIGGTDKRALFNLLDIALDYALECILNGYGTEINIRLLKDQVIEVEVDDIEEKMSPEIIENWNISGLEAMMCEVSYGWSRRDGYFPVSGGLHGIGLQALNSLADYCIVELKQDRYLWRQTYETGIPTSKVEQLRPLEDDEVDSTSISFIPDYTILDYEEFDFATIAQRCEDLAYLFPTAYFTVCDMRDCEYEEVYHFENGIVDWVEKTNSSNNKVHDIISVNYRHELYDRQGEPYQIIVDLAFQYIDADIVIERSFVNSVHVLDGSTHIDGLKKAICDCIWQDGQYTPKWDVVGRGFVGMINLLHPDPQFESSTIIKLLNPDAEYAVIEAVKIAFQQNPRELAKIREHFAKANL